MYSKKVLMRIAVNKIKETIKKCLKKNLMGGAI